MENRRGPGFALGFVIGALVGGALAMLLVPWWGEETRDTLRTKAREASDVAKDRLAGLTGEAGDAYARGAAAVEEFKSDVDDAVQEGRDAAAKHRADLQQRYLAEGSAP